MHYVLYAVLIAMVPLLWATRGEPGGMWSIFGVAALLLACAWTMEYLTIEDRGDGLYLHYGPLPLFRKSFPYRLMTRAEPGRTTILDGWGIHWVLGRGWTYNLWGFNCVVVRLGKRTIRIGTDDRENLAAFLVRKIRESAPGPPAGSTLGEPVNTRPHGDG